MDTHEGLRCVTSCVAARSDILTYMQALCKRLRLFTGRTDVDEAEEVEGIQMFSSQSTLSRRFRDPELETAYREDNFKVRGKALRVLNVILAIFYMLIILDAALKWGSLNVDPNLVQYNLLQYYIPLGLCLLLTGVVFALLHLSRFAFSNFFLLMVFHTAPTLLEAWSTGTLAAAAAAPRPTVGIAPVVELLAAWFMSVLSYLLAIMIVPICRASAPFAPSSRSITSRTRRVARVLLLRHLLAHSKSGAVHLVFIRFHLDGGLGAPAAVCARDAPPPLHLRTDRAARARKGAPRL